LFADGADEGLLETSESELRLDELESKLGVVNELEGEELEDKGFTPLIGTKPVRDGERDDGRLHEYEGLGWCRI
jgi:hypothetical protein